MIHTIHYIISPQPQRSRMDEWHTWTKARCPLNCTVWSWGECVCVCVCVCVHWEVMILCLNITWYWWRLSLASYFAIASLGRVWANYHGLSVWHWTVIINIELFYSRIFQVVQCKRELLYWLHTISGLLLCWQTLGTCRVCTHTHICWINMPHPSLEVYSNIMGTGMDQLDHLVTVKSFQMSRSEVRSSQSHGTNHTIREPETR